MKNTIAMSKWSRDSYSVDVRFKEKYRRFIKKWLEKYGWHFYKELSGGDVQHFTSLHLPSENNIRSFCEQMLIFVKATVDSLMEEMLIKDQPKVENEKGIIKLQHYWGIRNVPIPDLITFLRNLHDLRSGMMAHRFSNSNKNFQKAMGFFDLKEDSYRRVAHDIFVKSLYTLNTLGKYF